MLILKVFTMERLRLKKDQAEKEIDMIKSVVRNNWRELAKKNGISRGYIGA